MANGGTQLRRDRPCTISSIESAWPIAANCTALPAANCARLRQNAFCDQPPSAHLLALDAATASSLRGPWHSRLCGKMYCASCTAKYHVPLIFRQAVKNKEGPARVCMSCVDGCMKEKERASAPAGANGAGGASSSSSSLLSSSLTSMAARAVEIAPPAAWEEESAFVCCPKCSATKGSTHNCRVCGLLYCDKVRRGRADRSGRVPGAGSV